MTDDDLGRALRDAVSDIRPRGTLDEIRSRTDKVVPMNKRWLLPVLVAAAVLAVVVGGDLWLTNDHPNAPVSGTTPSPSATATATATATGTTGGTGSAVPVYYVGQTPHGPRLYREFQHNATCQSVDCTLKAAAVAAVSGQPADPDYRSLWPAGTTVGSVSYAGDVIVVDLAAGVHDRPTGMTAKDADLAVQQLVYSAQAAVGAGRLPVQLLIDGKHSDQVLGVPASEPLAAGNSDTVLAPVQIDDPVNGATLAAGSAGATIEVTGRAATFEANVVWELMQGSTVVQHGFTTAQECCTLSPYSFSVGHVAPGHYTLVVHDTDASGQNLPVAQDTKDLTVT